MKNRLAQYLRVKHLSMRAFAEKCSINVSVLSRISEATSPANLKHIDESSDLNVDWLLTGEGEMLKRAIDMGTSSTSVVSEKPFRTYFKEENVRMVPLLNIDSVGGMHSANEVGEYEPEFILDMLPFKGAIQGDVAIKETGDSMSPRIPSGAIMLLRRVMEWQEYFGYGHVFVLVLTDGRSITKRGTNGVENPNEYVLCESINPSYPSEELPKKMIFSVWKVIDVLVHEGY
ncbi:S24 family peptidase [Muribaculum sp.]|uniref:XRE family transcriptional regulator n=1 Tax=Muribaculum sp. TaxID=1918611 RepID=UPI0023C871A7|nr:S24 family peptidase [Muribaculum sp.]MDE5705135.1 hypothetical protein [Muribaculum sp.]